MTSILKAHLNFGRNWNQTLLFALAVLVLSTVTANGQSAPAFRVRKISTDVTGDPNTLRAGDTLYYTITVQNIGNEDFTNVLLRDAVPVNTTYVAGSTSLNGGTISDSGGFSPLVHGMPIHSPGEATSGLMRAGPASSQANVAIITFSVVVDPGVINGTVISNQAFVTAAINGIVDYPSDDPDTPIVNDPTRDTAGNGPLLYAEKRVALSVDLGRPGIVDPDDVLRYTITVQNSAATPATGVILRDSIPANASYVANSTRLNGAAVQQDGAVSPLTAGVNVGIIAARTTAVVQFDLRVNAGTPAGTMISNQAVVDSVELSDVLTDGDGNPATRPEPTVVIVGDGQQLSITKQVVVVGGGAAVPGARLEYIVRVTNISAAPALNVVITDNLDGSLPGSLVYVSGSATMNGRTPGVTFAGSTITANYDAIRGPLDPGAFVVLRFRAVLASGLADATVVTNTAAVAWNHSTQTASAGVSVIVGGVPGTTILNGLAWNDANFNGALDLNEEALENWVVDLFRDGRLLHSLPTDDVGVYRFVGVEPNDAAGSGYEVRFRAPRAGPNTAMLGITTSPFTNGMQRITNIVVSSGANLRGLNLPIHPNGVVYHSIERTVIAGAVLTLLDARTARPLPAGCFDDAAQQGQVTPEGGYYRFDVNFSDSACPTGGNYVIRVGGSGLIFATGYSRIIQPTSDASTAAFDVPGCPGRPVDAIPATALVCEVQPSELPPDTNVPPGAGTIYHVHMRLDGTRTPGTSQLFNNHIPLDPQPEGSLSISKTTPLRDVTRGQLVPYVITLNNLRGAPVTDVTVVDRFPAGFTYIAGSALLDGVPAEPSIMDRTLSWNGLIVTETQVRTVRLLLAVGAGVNEGDYVNRAQAMVGLTGAALTGEVTATVRIMPDPTFDCTDVTGKVFNDVNRNGRQDNGEDGLGGVRVVTPRGLQATTDQYGRYHITCAVTPDENRGSNFVLKLDDRTLPSGFRMSTNSLQIKRATRGKALPINFGASLHRVVSIDLSDAAFEPGKTDVRPQWQPRLNLLLEELRKAPAILRLSYVADTEKEGLVERRMQVIKSQLTKAWGAAKNSYGLAIEPEVFWRRGGPPRR